MVQSLNKKAELVVAATSFMGFADYGQVLLGDAGYEFYNDRDVNRYIQIPWTEVDSVVVSLLFGGRYIPRIAIKTKQGGMFTFSVKHPKKVLQTMNKHLKRAQFCTARSLPQILWGSIKDMLPSKAK